MSEVGIYDDLLAVCDGDAAVTRPRVAYFRSLVTALPRDLVLIEEGEGW